MLLILVLILILIGAAVVGSIYSNFLVFYSNFSESENYHRAYYTAISALERGELVVKQRSPGYVGSGGFILGKGTGSINNSNGGSDKNLSNFSYLGENTGNLTIFWTVNSKTNRIPNIGGGNIEGMLSALDSKDYNMMDYENAENFLLYYDKGDNNPYTKTKCPNGCAQSKPTQITGEIRLPQFLKDKGFGNLDESKSLIGLTSQLPKDDAIVDWQIRGKYIEPPYPNTPYTIYSTQTVAGEIIQYEDDTAFRESDINRTIKFLFKNKWNPISNYDPHTTKHGTSNPITIIGQSENDLKSSSSRFTYIFKNTENIQIRFSLLNLIKGKQTIGGNTIWNIYPFLEYYIDFGTDVADKYYTIDAEGSFADYQINITMQKPTVKESILSNFTSIF